MPSTGRFHAWSPRNPRRAELVQEDVWAGHRSDITQWYSAGLTKKEILGKLSSEKNFYPLMGQLVSCMRSWGLEASRGLGQTSEGDWSMDDIFEQAEDYPSSKPTGGSVPQTTSVSSTRLPYGPHKSKSAPILSLMKVDANSEVPRVLDKLCLPRSQSTALLGPNTKSPAALYGAWFGAPCPIRAVDAFFAYCGSADVYRTLPLGHGDIGVDYNQVWKLLSFSDCLVAAGLCDDAFDIYYSCFRGTIMFDPASADQHHVSSLKPDSSAWIKQRIVALIKHDKTLLTILICLAGCIRSSTTCVHVTCSGRILAALIMALREEGGCHPIFLQLLLHYHSELKRFPDEVAAWSLASVDSAPPCPAAMSNVLTEFPPSVRDREALFFLAKEQPDLDFPADNLLIGIGCVDIEPCKVARQFVASAFIRNRTAEMIEWCAGVLLKRQRWVDREILHFRRGLWIDNSPVRVVEQVIFWCLMAERMSATGDQAMTDARFASSQQSVFGLHIPEAIDALLELVLVQEDVAECFDVVPTSGHTAFSPARWTNERLLKLTCADGVSRFARHYYRRITSICNMWPSVADTGAKQLGIEYAQTLVGSGYFTQESPTATARNPDFQEGSTWSLGAARYRMKKPDLCRQDGPDVERSFILDLHTSTFELPA
ncbi:hypothetical protein A1O3_04123 [Capronia epimyces CBS 606.96]|uniref:Clr5 domain-containing protein n=1 Tax=Capronia epimyces CBS 606.96 TaxID=1182542 RepID=W9YXY5_9EURO|nr:uncharacterized protein A1O3_04123 [Capronia epimyces CBS 606.96]EXJ87164.1 hypothetical protein A1O3_04123 [Capronia epimyces CBS 606.96]